HEVFQAASIIKLPLLAVVLRMEAMGRVNLNERILVRNSDKMPSCGALSHFSDEPAVDIGTLCRLMIVISDNTATNLLIKRFGIEELHQEFCEIGLEKTRINRLLFDAEAAQQGIHNYFAPKEIGLLLEKIYGGNFVDEAVSGKIKEILLGQQIKHKIPSRLPREIRVAHKTGEDKGITHDAGIVFAQEPFVIVFASNETDVPVFEQIIRDIAYRCCRLA
ncbi:MAG: class A beta-lactamase-related serine hydrolase, partial [Eubacteriales bacterium]|nr:class A beta-lactamase-related serine hydrolase [Eubacteriales bacterium]